MDPESLQMPVTEGPVTPDRTPRYTLPVFEGPLELLLYLIQKNELDIADIPIALICRQYEDHLDQMRELDLDVAADFILMAATLILIGCVYLVLALRYWFRIPAIGIAIGTGCFVVAWVLSLS